MSYSSYQKSSELIATGPRVAGTAHTYQALPTQDEDVVSEKTRFKIEQLQQSVAHLTRLTSHLGTAKDSSKLRDKLCVQLCYGLPVCFTDAHAMSFRSVAEMDQCRATLKETKSLVEELHKRPHVTNVRDTPFNRFLCSYS